MDELCPLCLKMGANRKIKAIQINLEEALWTCESEECPWPFLGRDEPLFFPRKVGEKWAYEWQTYRRVREQIGSIPVSAELSLYTPPVTPSGDASAKENQQSEVPKNILESAASTEIFSGDSYAPRLTAEAVSSVREKAATTRDPSGAEDNPRRGDGDSRIVEKQPAARSSIFDIDGEEFISNKINAKLRRDSESPDRPERTADDAENFAAPIDRHDAVLKTLPMSDITVKSPEMKRDIADLRENGENSEGAAKRVPQIRSIARTNIDLQRFDPAAAVKIEKPTRTRNVETPATPPRRKSGDAADRLVSPTQRTTTIKVDGIPPIVLSYNLTDLGGMTEESAPATSTPIPPRKSSPVDEVPDEKLSPEIPKKRARFPAKKKSANSGKAFEKFSFSALKKATRSANAEDATPAVKMEPPQLDEILNRNRSCARGSDDRSSTKDFVAPGAIANSSETVDSSRRVEAPSSTNPDAGPSIASPAVDNLNLSCFIDDMLLDGYQNATQNLNDDWLESFFAENT